VTDLSKDMRNEKSSGEKHCLRCLLQEYDEEAYLSKLKRVILLMKASERAPEEVTGKRLDTCRQCDYLERGTCLACGCYVELKAVYKDGHCPKKKW
jgi:hypothetical protein